MPNDSGHRTPLRPCDAPVASHLVHLPTLSSSVPSLRKHERLPKSPHHHTHYHCATSCLPASLLLASSPSLRSHEQLHDLPSLLHLKLLIWIWRRVLGEQVQVSDVPNIPFGAMTITYIYTSSPKRQAFSFKKLLPSSYTGRGPYITFFS